MHPETKSATGRPKKVLLTIHLTGMKILHENLAIAQESFVQGNLRTNLASRQ